MAGLNNAKQSSSRKKYTGLFKFEVLGYVNPTPNQIEVITGYAPKNERPYVNLEINGQMYSRVLFYLQTKDPDEKPLTLPVEFLIADRLENTSSTGKTKYINGAGLTSWLESPEMAADWFKNAGNIRPAKVGEANLLNFFIKLGNLDTYNVDASSPIKFEDFSKICKGDVTELRNYITQPESNFYNRKVYGLIYVDNGKYMKVWNNAFESEASSKFASIKRELENTTFFNDKNARNFQGTLIQKEYIEVDVPDAIESTIEEMDDSSADIDLSDSPFGSPDSGEEVEF